MTANVRSGQGPTLTLMRSWQPWDSATTSPTAWRASKTVAGYC
jgi:hypothetical protein